MDLIIIIIHIACIVSKFLEPTLIHALDALTYPIESMMKSQTSIIYYAYNLNLQ